MKSLVLQEDLLKSLNLISRFVSTKAPLPILSNVLISADKNKLKFAATNLEMGISMKIGARVEEDGEITVPARILLELVSNFPAGQIKIETQGEKVLLSTDKYSIDISGILASEFPKVLGDIGKKDLDFPKSVIQAISKQVIFSASNDESRPVLTGVLLVSHEGKAQAVSTDGFRLSSKNVGAFSQDINLLIPSKTIDELARIVTNGDSEVGLSVLEENKQLVFTFEDLVLSSRLLEGDFPDFQKIIPNKYNHKVKVSRDEFNRAVKAASVFARENSNIVLLKINEDKIVVSSESSQHGKDQISVDAKTEGEGVQIAFNYKYVLDFLASVEGDEISIETEGAMNPGVFRDTKDSTYFHLIMPVRIQG